MVTLRPGSGGFGMGASVAMCFALVACAGILDIQERRLRAEDGGPAIGTGGEGAGGAASGATEGGAQVDAGGTGPASGGGPGFGGTSQCATAAGICTGCLCADCPAELGECTRNPTGCDALGACIALTGCTDNPPTCEQKCSDAIRVGDLAAIAPKLAECMAHTVPCPGCNADSRVQACAASLTQHERCAGCICTLCDVETIDGCGKYGCNEIVECMATTHCKGFAECNLPQNCAALISQKGIGQPFMEALTACLSQNCTDCAAGAATGGSGGASGVCTVDGKPCDVQDVGPGGICLAGVCAKCNGAPNIIDPQCENAYGGVQACCSMGSRTCSACAAGTGGAGSTSCSNEGGMCVRSAGGQGICRALICTSCTAGGGIVDAACQNAYGAALGCCSATGSCTPCTGTCTVEHQPCTFAGGAGYCQAAICGQCSTPTGTIDPGCQDAYGVAQACCSAAQQCVPCSASCGANGTACNYNGLNGGICTGGVCQGCTGAAGTGDPSCGQAYGAALGCCSAQHVCSGCAGTTCTDNLKNGSESDVDCGGPACPPCATNKLCQVSTDCADFVCGGVPAICQAATCTDSLKNGNESDVDCGGPCQGCAAGKACRLNPDCETGLCASNVCVP